MVIGSSILTRPSVSESLSSCKPNTLSITFLHHGRRGSPPITLCTDSNSIQQIWTKKISDQQALLTEKKRIFTLKPLISKYFASTNRINSTYTIGKNKQKSAIICTTIFNNFKYITRCNQYTVYTHRCRSRCLHKYV
jgi:hypothetical protein